MVALLGARRGHTLSRPHNGDLARRLVGRMAVRWPVRSGCLARDVFNPLAQRPRVRPCSPGEPARSRRESSSQRVPSVVSSRVSRLSITFGIFDGKLEGLSRFFGIREMAGFCRSASLRGDWLCFRPGSSQPSWKQSCGRRQRVVASRVRLRETQGRSPTDSGSWSESVRQPARSRRGVHLSRRLGTWISSGSS
jgi:hypothetical protein